MASVTLDYVSLARRASSHLNIVMSERLLKDYQPFFDSLAPDMALISVSPEGTSEVHSKQDVIDYVSDWYHSLSGPDVVEDVQLEKPLEFYGGHERVVILWVECTKNRKTGKSSNSKEVAVIMDFKDGLIKRLLRFSQ